MNELDQEALDDRRHDGHVFRSRRPGGDLGMSPRRWIDGIQRSTGMRITGWAWFPSHKYRDEKRQLSELLDEWLRETEAYYAEHGYYTATRSWPKIEDWVDETIDHYRYNGQTRWQRNWFPLIMLVMMGGSMLVIGLVNGWS